MQRRKAECDAEFRALARLMTFNYILAFAWGQNDCEIWDPKEAIKLLEPIVAADADDRWSRLALATNYRLTNRFDEVEETLRPLGKSDPDALAIRVQSAIDRGDFPAADQLAREGPAANPRLDVLRGRLALLLLDPRQAVVYLRGVLRQEPSNRDALQSLAVALRKLDDPEADTHFQTLSRHDRLKRIIIACGNSSRIEFKTFDELGELCESLGRIEQARVWYQVAIGWDPLDARAQRALARLGQSAGADALPAGGKDKGA